MKMNIKRIEINIKDDWRYGLVASLIDRADFLQDIEAIRKKHKIKKLFSREEIENETLKQFDETTNYFRKPDPYLLARLQQSCKRSQSLFQ